MHRNLEYIKQDAGDRQLPDQDTSPRSQTFSSELLGKLLFLKDELNFVNPFTYVMGSCIKELYYYQMAVKQVKPRFTTTSRVIIF